MKKEERQNHIRNMLNSTGTVTVNEIMQELSVSDMTVSYAGIIRIGHDCKKRSE